MEELKRCNVFGPLLDKMEKKAVMQLKWNVYTFLFLSLPKPADVHTRKKVHGDTLFRQ